MGTPFGSEKVIIERISEAELKTYLVGFDIDSEGQRYYRLDNLIGVLQRAIPEFAFGHHEGTNINITRITDILREAARSIYRIEEFQKTRDVYVKGGCIADDDAQKKFLRRGEFGELILHLLLRDFHATVPLLSKIYFKDAYGSTVHGFDAVHIYPNEKTLWLGESKLYFDGKKGIKALIQDVKDHFQSDYLNEEFAIVSKKLKLFDNIPEKEHWLEIMDKHTKLSDVLNSVTIPLLCTYSSYNFTKYDNENLQDFVADYEKEVRELKSYFDENCNHPLKTSLNIILLLFPIQCKSKFVKGMHEKLWLMQGI
jgi:hypothetical protein